MFVHRLSSAEKAAKSAGHLLSQLLESVRGQDCLLLLSAGSSLSVLQEVDAEVLGPHITISMLDERYSQDPTVSNYLQLTKLPFYQRATDHNCTFLPTTMESGETVEGMGTRLHRQMFEWQHAHPAGTIIATIGVGRDGHTAGIMPYPNNPEEFSARFVETDQLMVGYDAEHRNAHPKRVTATLPLFSHINHGVVYMVGQDKQPLLHTVESLVHDNSATLPHTVPAVAIRRIPDVTIFTDIDL